MKIKLLAGAAIYLLLVTSGVSGQTDHAPTFDQCMGDMNLWDSETDVDAPLIKKTLEPLTAVQLASRGYEMETCNLAYSDRYGRRNLEKSALLTRIYSIELMSRYSDFVTRHHLQDKFFAEDKAGLR